MRSNANVDEKMSKTGTVLGIASLLMAPLLLIDARLGLVAMLAVDGILLASMHDVGRRRRPGSNALVVANSIFADRANRQVAETDNAIRNVINGGAALYDDLATAAEIYSRRCR